MKEHEITSGTVTYYEVIIHLKRYTRVFKKCFKREERYRLLALRNIENLEIVTHVCDFTNDRVYCEAISYLIRTTRRAQALSYDEEVLRAQRESEWTCFLVHSKKLIDEYEGTINYLTKVSEDFLADKTNDFPKKGELRLKTLHNELRRLFLTKEGGSLLENTLKFLSKYYKKESQADSVDFFTFPIGSHEIPMPSQARREKNP